MKPPATYAIEASPRTLNEMLFWRGVPYLFSYPLRSQVDTCAQYAFANTIDGIPATHSGLLVAGVSSFLPGCTKPPTTDAAESLILLKADLQSISDRVTM